MKSLLIQCVTVLCIGATPALAQYPGATYEGQLSANPYASPQYQPQIAPSYGPPPVLYDQQGQYRGNMSSNPYDPDSINNPYGIYGSPYSPDSINNPYGAGNPYDPGSATNPYGQGWSVYRQ